MNSFRSLAFKNAIYYLIIFLIGLGVMGFLLLESSSKKIIKNAEDQLLHSSELIDLQIQEYIDELVTDLLFLSQNPVLERYLDQNTPDNYKLLNAEFFSLISSNSDYGQIRFLDADSGKELVRVDRLNGNPVITPVQELQIKKNRPYFSQAIDLDTSEIYFSSIDLNKEFGVISTPYTPTLRIAKPIYFNGLNRGIVVINTDLSKLFDKLSKSVGTNFNLRIFNEEGFYLQHEVKDSTFTFEFGSTTPQVVLNKESPTAGVQSADNELISWHFSSIPQMGYNVYYHVIANKSELLAPYYVWVKHSLYRILLIALVFTGIAFFILRNQFKNLQKLITNIKEYPIKRKVSALPKNRNDEIGELAKSFEEMVDIINNQIDTIELEKHKAELAEKDKSKFIENITHEIRNPLQSIIGLSTILEQNKPNSNQIEILKSIRLNTTNLNALVNSILDYQNILSGTLKVKRQYSDISNLIQDLVTGIKYTANQKNINIETSIDKKLSPLEVNIDKLRVSQILNNLISNAIANTPTNGKISIELLLVENIGDQSKINFLVSDNGVGMSKPEMEKITERYYTKSEDSRLNPNYGLGLTIVNELLGMMNSKLVIESEKNIGSTFSFELQEKTRPKLIIEDAYRVHDKIFKDKKILIIEDDDQVLNLYKYYFEESDATFVSSFDPLKISTDITFDLVITDYFLKGTSLDDNIQYLQNVVSESTSLIIVSGQHPESDQLKNFFPNNVFAQKPITKESLIQSIITADTIVRFGRPYLEAVKNDYDNDSSKYRRAFVLLLKEWKIYQERLIENIRDKNVDGFEEVLHKLNNTLRRLQLSRFEHFLLRIKEDLNKESFNADAQSKEIAEIMRVYYDYIDSAVG